MSNLCCQGQTKVESKYTLIGVKNKLLKTYVYEEDEYNQQFNLSEYNKMPANRKLFLLLNKKIMVFQKEIILEYVLPKKISNQIIDAY
jgi:hypothetical protein